MKNNYEETNLHPTFIKSLTEIQMGDAYNLLKSHQNSFDKNETKQSWEYIKQKTVSINNRTYTLPIPIEIGAIFQINDKMFTTKKIYKKERKKLIWEEIRNNEDNNK